MRARALPGKDDPEDNGDARPSSERRRPVNARWPAPRREQELRHRGRIDSLHPLHLGDGPLQRLLDPGTKRHRTHRTGTACPEELQLHDVVRRYIEESHRSTIGHQIRTNGVKGLLNVVAKLGINSGIRSIVSIKRRGGIVGHGTSGSLGKNQVDTTISTRCVYSPVLLGSL